MAASGKLQDMPPEGGYKPITFSRIPAKKYFSGSTLIAGYLGVTAAAAYVYYLQYKEINRNEIEERSSKIAITPILLAERDREYLKQLRRNRDEEVKLMANVPGWEVGTWYGEPVFKTIPPDELVTPWIYEYYAHANPKSLTERIDISLWS